MIQERLGLVYETFCKRQSNPFVHFFQLGNLAASGIVMWCFSDNHIPDAPFCLRNKPNSSKGWQSMCISEDTLSYVLEIQGCQSFFDQDCKSAHSFHWSVSGKHRDLHISSTLSFITFLHHIKNCLNSSHVADLKKNLSLNTPPLASASLELLPNLNCFSELGSQKYLAHSESLLVIDNNSHD